MIGTSKAGWAVILSDLALILFIISASDTEIETGSSDRRASLFQARYEVSSAGPALVDWIHDQGLGEGAQLQITAGYSNGEIRLAMDRIVALSDEAERAGMQPRLLLIPGDEVPVVTLSYD